MSTAHLYRGVEHVTGVKLTNAAGTTAVIDLEGFTTLSVAIPNGYVSTSLTIHAYDPQNDNYQPLYDDTATAVTYTIAANRLCNLPAAVFNHKKIKLVTNNAGDNNVNVGLIKKG